MSSRVGVAECLICDRVHSAREGRNPFLIAEFDHSIFVVGDHQFHRGYSLVLLKEHIREPHELAPDLQAAHFADVMRAGRAANEAFKPWKINYACYGNSEPHVHWHIFPRYSDDADRERNPWLHADRFRGHAIDSSTARDLAARIRVHLS